MDDFYRIGDKIVSMEKLTRSLTRMMSLRSEGVSQQEVADRCGVDRSFISRLEGIIQDGDGNAFLIIEYCTFGCRFVYFYYTENKHMGNLKQHKGSYCPIQRYSTKVGW
jgi:hypothetical protein